MKNSVTFRSGLTKYWWIPLLTGLISIGFGIWCFCAPAESLTVMAYVFAGLMCAAALLNFFFAFASSRFDSGWGWSLALGLLEMFCGVWMFSLPTAVLVSTFIFVIGIWIIVAAINSICEACMLSSVSPWWIFWMILLLIATIGFAFIFMSDPIIGGVAVWLWIGISLLTFGLYRIIWATQIKKLNRDTDGML